MEEHETEFCSSSAEISRHEHVRSWVSRVKGGEGEVQTAVPSLPPHHQDTQGPCMQELLFLFVVMG